MKLILLLTAFIGFASNAEPAATPINTLVDQMNMISRVSLPDLGVDLYKPEQSSVAISKMKSSDVKKIKHLLETYETNATEVLKLNAPNAAANPVFVLVVQDLQAGAHQILLALNGSPEKNKVAAARIVELTKELSGYGVNISAPADSDNAMKDLEVPQLGRVKEILEAIQIDASAIGAKTQAGEVLVRLEKHLAEKVNVK